MAGKTQNKKQRSIFGVDNSDEGDKSKKPAAWVKIKNKNDVVKWERNNFYKIVFYHTGSDFWQATMNSCLFMVNLVHEQLELKSKIKSVLDYYLGSDRIYTAYHKNQVDRMRRELPKLGMNMLRDEDSILVFQMAKAISPDMISDWAKVEEIRKKKLDAYLLPVTGSADLYVHIRELGRYTILATDKMRASMAPFAATLISYLEEIYQLHINLEKKKMHKILGSFAYFVQILNDEKIIDDKKAHRIGFLLHNIRKELAMGKVSQAAD